MLGWFPDPYPDELFYSVCARYSERMNYKNNMHVFQDIFGESFSCIYIHLVTRLDYLITSLPAENNYTADRLIDEHTSLSFYSAFHPPYLIKMLRDAIKQNNPEVTLNRFENFMRNMNYLRFCPQCILEDKSNLVNAIGIAYIKFLESKFV